MFRLVLDSANAASLTLGEAMVKAKSAVSDEQFVQLKLRGWNNSGFSLINTQLQLGVGTRWSVATVSTVSRLVDLAKLLKQFGSARSTNHPSEEGC